MERGLDPWKLVITNGSSIVNKQLEKNFIVILTKRTMAWILKNHFAYGHCCRGGGGGDNFTCARTFSIHGRYSCEQSSQLRSKSICLQAPFGLNGSLARTSSCICPSLIHCIQPYTGGFSKGLCPTSRLFVQVAFCTGFSTETVFVVPFEHGPVKTLNSRALTSSWLYVHLVRLCKLWHVDVNLSHICRWLYQSVISFQNKFEQKKTLPTVCKPTRSASFQICLFTWALAVLLRLSKRDGNWTVPVCS